MSATDFTIFNRTTGEILRSGRCPEKLVAKQARAGESVLVGQALCDVQHRIEVDVSTGAKQPRRYADEEIVDRAPRGWRPRPGSLAMAAEAVAAKGINPALATRLVHRRLTAALEAKERSLRPF